MTGPASPTPNAALTTESDWMKDGFVGDNAALIDSITALLSFPDAALSHRIPGTAKTLLMSAAVRLATPSPADPLAAQDDPAKGLEVVAHMRLGPTGGSTGVSDIGPSCLRSGDAPVIELVKKTAADERHATTTRQIAELEARVAEWEMQWDKLNDLYAATLVRALAAEADAARVREAILSLPKREERLGGQRHKYIQLDSILEVFDEAAK